MYITAELLKNIGWKGETVEGELIDIFLDRKSSDSLCHLLYNFCDKNQEEVRAYKTRMFISDSNIYANSRNICNCYVCKDSQGCNNSKYVFGSSNVDNSYVITNSNEVVDSYEINNSCNVLSSRHIYNSHKVEKSEAVDESDSVFDSTYVINSQHIEKCLGVFKCLDLVDSAFCINCIDSNNLLFCKDMCDASYAIFNIPVTKEDYAAALSIIFPTLTEDVKRISKRTPTFLGLIEIIKKRSQLLLQLPNCPFDFFKNFK